MVVSVPYVSGHPILLLRTTPRRLTSDELVVVLDVLRYFLRQERTMEDGLGDVSECGAWRMNCLRSGLRVARDAAMTPRPSSTQDQTARPRMWPKKAVEFSVRAGMYLKRTMDAMLPLHICEEPFEPKDQRQLTRRREKE
jgi:hypothetical protein